MPEPTMDDNNNLLIRNDDDIAGRKSKGVKHTKLVRVMRLILPVIALSFVAMVMSFAGGGEKLTPVQRDQILPTAVSSNELTNPKFQSEDAKGQQYTITATKALQNANNMDDILLEKPMADMTLNNKGWVAIKADTGVYNQLSGNLNLSGGVRINHNSGYELNSNELKIDVKSSRITSSTGVTGHGADADITATGLNADGLSGRVIFIGPAKLILRKENK